MSKAKGWSQGFYKPINPEKYKGDVNQIVFRSSWEQQFAKFLDCNIHVLQWGSEEFSIPYFHPLLNRPAQYFPDFWCRYNDKFGNTKVEVIEIKPSNQVNKPSGKNREQMETWILNMAKWQAAVKFCKERNLLFRILTEKSLYKSIKK